MVAGLNGGADVDVSFDDSVGDGLVESARSVRLDEIDVFHLVDARLDRVGQAFGSQAMGGGELVDAMGFLHGGGDLLDGVRGARLIGTQRPAPASHDL